MTTRPSRFLASEAEISKGLQEALRASLQKWQLETGHALRFWLRGYCAFFAATLVKFIGDPASLSSVVASDGNIHHIVVVLCDLVIDARGVNTKKSLLAEINREAEANNSSLRAVDIIPFELQHLRLLKECPDNQGRALKACFNTPAMRRIRSRIKIVASGRDRAESGSGGETTLSDGAERKSERTLGGVRQIYGPDGCFGKAV